MIKLLAFCLLLAQVAATEIDERIVICGVCKDIAHCLPSTIEAIHKMGDLFLDYRVLVYENNSVDATVPLLRDWEQHNPRVFVISETLTQEQMAQVTVTRSVQGNPYRCELIARARNILYDIALGSAFDDFGYLLVVDMDMLEYGIDGIVDSFQQREVCDWDAVFANGLEPDRGPRMYDRYAFRDRDMPFGPESLGMPLWLKLESRCTVQGKQGLVPVYSAFGGMALYKRSSIGNARESAVPTQDSLAWLKQYVHSPARNEAAMRLYQQSLGRCNQMVPWSSLPVAYQEDTGVYLDEDPAVVLRFHWGAGGYPGCREHVPLHLGMIMQGHDKLFINPAMVTVPSGVNGPLLPKGWEVPEFIWNFGLVASCDLGPSMNPNDYFRFHYSNDATLPIWSKPSLPTGSVVWLRCRCVARFAREVLPHLSNPIVLVICDGDDSFPSDCFGCDIDGLLNHTKILHVFAQNCDLRAPHPKVSHLPIGMDFHTLAYKEPAGFWGEFSHPSPFEQEKQFKEILATLKPTHLRKKKAFVDFLNHGDTIRTGDKKRYLQFGEDRTAIFERLLPTGLIDHGDAMKRSDLWRTKGEYAFSISPYGNGLDCHRTWEDLALGCIVIVKTSPLDPLYEGLPVVIVRDWSEITEENLTLWLHKYSDAFSNPAYRKKLTTSYWLHRIRAQSHDQYHKKITCEVFSNA